MAFINNEDPNAENQAAPTLTPATQSAPSPMMAQAPVVNQPKGSGRFTNIQKYISANEGAGSRLASGIGTKIQGQVNPELDRSKSQINTLREGIEAGQGKLQQGNQIRSQVENTNFDAEAFINQPASGFQFPTREERIPIGGTVQPPNLARNHMYTAEDQARNEAGLLAMQGKTIEEMKQYTAAQQSAQNPMSNLERFTQFRTGQAIDEKALQDQAIQNQQLSESVQKNISGFSQQLGNDSGRSQLLKQTFSPGRNYSVGQQRLDNLFLSRATPELQNIQTGLKTSGDELTGVLDQNRLKQDAIRSLAQQETDLSSGLVSAIGARDTDLENSLKTRIGEVNTQRGAERDKYNQFVNSLLSSGQGKKIDNPLDESLIKEAGLQLGQQTFNVFKNPNLASNEFLNISERNANNIQDVAKQQDVEKYKALATLGGYEANKLTKAGELERAASFKTGEGSAAQRVKDARMKFLEDAVKQNIAGSGAQNWKSKDTFRGKKGTETATASLNLNNFLGGDYQTALANQSNANPGTVAQQMSQATPEQLAAAAAANSGLASAGLASAGLTGLTSIANALPSVFGDPNAGKQSRARTAAQAQANQDAMNKLGEYLKSQGFDQYLGNSGVSTGSANIEDYGYGQEDKSNSGLYNMLRNLPKVT